MSAEPLHIFDPRRNLQLQGFAGRAATTTLHDATETGISISGIFQAAEDFAVLGWWNAYDYFNHLRLKHLPKTDLSGLKLEFDIEYDQTLDGAIRFDAAKFPSVSWDAMTFVTGAGDIHEVRLLDHATVVSGSETAATVRIDISCEENMDGGIDWLHLYFRDTRYTVTGTDCRVETQLTATVNAGDASLPVQSTAGFSAADEIWIERTGTNEEQTTVVGVGTSGLNASVSMGHPSGSFVTRKTKAWHVAQKLANIINTAGASVAGRFGPDQSGVIHAQAWVSGPSTGGITITFVLASGTTSRYGKLGNLDRVFLAHGHTLGSVPVGSGQGFQWSAGREPASCLRTVTTTRSTTRLHADFAGQERRGRSDERLPEDVHGLRSATRERRGRHRRRMIPHRPWPAGSRLAARSPPWPKCSACAPRGTVQAIFRPSAPLATLHSMSLAKTSESRNTRPSTNAPKRCFRGCPAMKEGYWYANDAPGWGIEVDEKAAAKYPFGSFEQGERKELNGGWGEIRRRDGTVIKQ